jgi:hypothetical protein
LIISDRICILFIKFDTHENPETLIRRVIPFDLYGQSSPARFG